MLSLLKGPDLEHLIPLYDDNPFHDWLTLSVLSGDSEGAAYTDDVGRPIRALVMHGGGWMDWLGPDPDPENLDEWADLAAGYKSRREFVRWVEFSGCPAALADALEKRVREPRRYRRIEWALDPERFAALPAPRLPQDILIRPAVPHDLDDEPLRLEMEIFFDGARDVIDHAGGVVARTREGRLAGFCMAAAWCRREWEIDIEVMDGWRRQGIGYAMGHAFIALCLERGVIPRWNCRDDNAPSATLAAALGFAETGRRPVFNWVTG